MTAVGAVGYAAYQRSTTAASAGADQPSPIQSLLGQAQAQSDQRSGTGLLDRVAGQATGAGTTGSTAPSAVPGAPGGPATSTVQSLSDNPVRSALGPASPAVSISGDEATLSPGASPPPAAVPPPADPVAAAPPPAPPTRSGASFVSSSSPTPTAAPGGAVQRGVIVRAGRRLIVPEMCN